MKFLDVFPEMSIGEKIRQARQFGVAPDITMNEGAFDDSPEEEGVIDPYCDPRVDALDLVDHFNSLNESTVQSLKEPLDIPSVDPTPDPNVE